MGKMSLPSISKIEDVLDLLTDPEKYIQYMTEFKQAYDEAHNALGDLKIKGQADMYLASAVDKYEESQKKALELEKRTITALAEAERALTDADVKSASVIADAEERSRSVAYERENFDEYKERRKTELNARCQTLSEMSDSVAKERERLMTWDKELSDQKSKLDAAFKIFEPASV